VLDVDWRDNVVFASCSGDATVAVCGVGRSLSIVVLRGHSGEVNKVEWDHSGRQLASCSDDGTIRVWQPFDPTWPVVRLTGHTHHVYTIHWAPGSTRVLVSGAFDSTVRLWVVHSGVCTAIVQGHTEFVYTVRFSPKGRFFASGGGVDQNLHVWRTAGAELAATYKASGAIFEVAWDPTGTNIAVCLVDPDVALIRTGALPFCQE